MAEARVEDDLRAAAALSWPGNREPLSGGRVRRALPPMRRLRRNAQTTVRTAD